MADLIEGAVWLLDGTVCAMISVLDGLIGIITYLPSILINLSFLTELLIVGIFSSIKLIMTFLWYSSSFLFHMPSNLGHFINSMLSASSMCLIWSFGLISLFTSSLLSLGFQIFYLFKQLFFYMIDSFSRFSYLVTFKTANAFFESLFYIWSRIKDMCIFLITNLQSLIHWPFRVFLNSCEAIYNDVISICLRLFRSLSNVPQACLAKLSSFHFFSSFDSRNYNLNIRSKFKEYPSYSVGWLTRFSQLMLAFAVIIFVAVALVVLYHMRFKVLTAVTKLFNLFVRKLSNIFQIGQHGINRHNRDGAHVPLEGRRVEQDIGNAGSDEDVDDDEENRAVLQPRPPVNESRVASAERDMGPTWPSTSTGSTYNYKRLLQEERDKQLCVVCQDNEKNILIFPCKHLCACNDCVEQITSSVLLDSRRCPLCRTKISSYLDIYT